MIEELFPWEPPQRPGGRPPIPPRACLEVLLWLLRNGGRLQDLPKSSPSESTLRRRLAEWTTKGIFIEVWSRLAELADELVRIDWSQLIADGTFCPAKKGELVADGHKRKGTIALVLMDNRQTPLAVNPQFRSEDSASRLTVKRFQSLAAANSA